MTLRDRLTEHRKLCGFLPGCLEMMLDRPYFKDEDIINELTRAIEQLQRCPSDGSLDSLTRNEKRFLKNFANDARGNQ